MNKSRVSIVLMVALTLFSEEVTIHVIAARLVKNGTDDESQSPYALR